MKISSNKNSAKLPRSTCNKKSKITLTSNQKEILSKATKAKNKILGGADNANNLNHDNIYHRLQNRSTLNKAKIPASK